MSEWNIPDGAVIIGWEPKEARLFVNGVEAQAGTPVRVGDKVEIKLDVGQSHNEGVSLTGYWDGIYYTTTLNWLPPSPPKLTLWQRLKALGRKR